MSLSCRHIDGSQCRTYPDDDTNVIVLLDVHLQLCDLLLSHSRKRLVRGHFLGGEEAEEAGLVLNLSLGACLLGPLVSLDLGDRLTGHILVRVPVNLSGFGALQKGLHLAVNHFHGVLLGQDLVGEVRILVKGHDDSEGLLFQGLQKLGLDIGQVGQHCFIAEFDD
ncbi:probable enoyl- mitochondrial-like, putative [Babesia ovis]|uniref:Probable enoyl- mitochondrial-like, putative n=1 Tax=Babesia ovis TaxID=5869 RepID=A0A9W5WWI5_BABOV|nr:probable enoyl- mitochondrial-like, putative [Babesia ovis]